MFRVLERLMDSLLSRLRRRSFTGFAERGKGVTGDEEDDGSCGSEGVCGGVDERWEVELEELEGSCWVLDDFFRLGMLIEVDIAE